MAYKFDNEEIEAIIRNIQRRYVDSIIKNIENYDVDEIREVAYKYNLMEQLIAEINMAAENYEGGSK